MRRQTNIFIALAFTLLLAGCVGHMLPPAEVPGGVMTFSIDLTAVQEQTDPITHGYVTLTKQSLKVQKELDIVENIASATVRQLYVGEWHIEAQLFSGDRLVARGEKSVVVRADAETEVGLTLTIFEPERIPPPVAPPDAVEVVLGYSLSGATYPIFRNFEPDDPNAAGYIVYYATNPEAPYRAFGSSDPLADKPSVTGRTSTGATYYKFRAYAAVDTLSELSELTVVVRNDPSASAKEPSRKVVGQQPTFEWTGPNTFTQGYLVLVKRESGSEYEFARRELHPEDESVLRWDEPLTPGDYAWFVVFVDVVDTNEVRFVSSLRREFTVGLPN